jgi:hypothetical protein
MIVNNILRSGIIILTLITSGISQVYSQGIREIIQKLNLYIQKYPEEIVYIQTDRSNYSPGEIIWFKAYIIQDIGTRRDSLSRNLFIELVDIDTNQIAKRVFLIDKNLSSGSILIPEMATTGKYKLIAYTSWMKNTPIDRVFSKDIVIENENRNAFTISITLKDTIYLPNTTLKANLEFRDKDQLPVSASFAYRLTGIKGTIFESEGKTDKSGNAEVSTTLPAFEAQDNLRLLVDSKRNNTNSSSGIVIPTPDNYIDVKFYPEGGLLLYGAESRIAFRAFNIADRPVDFKGEIITAQGKLVKDIESTYMGIGSFRLNPVKGETYYLKITSPSSISKTFMLPAPRISGAIMSVDIKTPEALTLNFIQLNKPGQVYNFIAQMKGKVYWSESMEVTDQAKLSIPLENFPSGIAEITAFDASGNLSSKRLVFINENKKLNIDVKTDIPQYGRKSKVTLSISVSDEKGNPVEAELSLAAINKELNNLTENNNIFSYLNLKSNLLGYIPIPQGFFVKHEFPEDVIDNLLIPNFFSRFTWQAVIRTKESDPSYSKIDDDNDKLIYSDFDKNDAAYITRELINDLMSPGKYYIVQEKNDMQKILNPRKQGMQKKTGYDPGTNIMDLIYTIKPYSLMIDEIIFSGVGINSINFAGGAGIVIDGVYTGTKPSVLTSLAITEIEKINVYTNPIDIQRFTGLNSMGIIEVLTKRGDSSDKTPEPEKLTTNSGIPPANSQNPANENLLTWKQSKSGSLKTIYWNASVKTDKTGQATITYLNRDVPSEVAITVEGRASSGLVGSSNKSYIVK